MQSWLRFLLVAAFLFVSVPASAAPITYGWTSGTITVQGRQFSDNPLIVDETLQLGANSFLNWDPTGTPTGFGVGTITDFLMSLSPNQGLFMTLQDWGPWDQFNVETGDIFNGPLFETVVSFGGSVSTTGIVIDATYSAFDSGGGFGSGPGQAANVEDVNEFNSTLTFGAGTVQLSVAGVVMGRVDGTPFGEAGNDLILTANIAFFGDSSVTPVPEPSTGLLLAMGLVAMTAAQRKNRELR